MNIQPTFMGAKSLEEVLNAGKALLGQARYLEAIVCLDSLLSINPTNAEAYFYRGIALHKVGRLQEAAESYFQAIKLCPSAAVAHSNLGVVLNELKLPEKAIASLERALALDVNLAVAHNNKGIAFVQMGLLESAVAAYDQALGINPNYAEAHYNRGVVLNDMRRLNDALLSYDKALAIDQNHAQAHNNRGNVLKDLKHYEEALAAYDRALSIKPVYADALHNKGIALLEMKRFIEAVSCFDQTLAINPQYEFIRGTCQHTRMKLCDWNSFTEQLSLLQKAIADNKRVTTVFPALHIIDSPRLQQQAAEIYTRAKHPALVSSTPARTKPANSKLSLGYVSCDFKEHAVSYLMAGVFEAHDRERFEVYGYDIGPAPDSPTRSRVIAAFDQFKIVSDLSNKGIAEQIRQDQIDILIDLTGYTKGARTGIFAYKPAPIQINYLGFPGTMGAPFMDYIIADRVLIPEEHRQFYTEQVLYLPHCFQANDDKRVIAPPKPKSHFGLPEDAFVFGCFNQSAKFTPTLFEVWLSILRQVPNSVLWLIEDNPTQVKNLRTYTQERGVDPNRLIFTGKLPYPEHLARYAHIDLVLDTLPFNGGTTTSDALWGGAPVLTCIGQTFAGRMSASLLTAIGLPELITHSLEDYERLAIDLATHPEQLKALRQRLDQNRAECPLFNSQLCAQHLEAAFDELTKVIFE